VTAQIRADSLKPSMQYEEGKPRVLRKDGTIGSADSDKNESV